MSFAPNPTSAARGTGPATGLIDRLAASVRGLAGWRRAGLAVLLGAIATTALPPLHFLPSAVVAFSCLVWLVDSIEETGRRAIRCAFAVGWWFGLGHFSTGLYWISHALLVDPVQFGWMIPFAVFGLSAGLAIFPAFAIVGLHLTGAAGWSRILVFAVAWTAAEWLRGHVLTGFPWNLIGTIWAETPVVAQIAALVGLYGLGLVTVALCALPATIAGRGPRRRVWAPTLVGVVLFAAIAVGGAIRLAQSDAGVVPGVHLRLVQPNIPQSLKWDPVLKERHLRHTMVLTRAPGFEGRTHVIWPETATPFSLTDNAALRQALAAVTPSGGLLITGAPRVERYPGGEIRLWNSLHAVDGSGEIAATYDKFHLVPFGEYVPLRSILDFAKITAGTIDFSSGPGPRTVRLPGLPDVSPLICYEAIFPGAVTAPDERPGWLLNLTNDAWFGISSGPYQHFAAARFRAIEEGLPLVRSANNGISAVVDAYGRVTARLGLGDAGVLDADLPQAIAATPYARFGDITVLCLAGLVLFVAAFGRRTA